MQRRQRGGQQYNPHEVVTRDGPGNLLVFGTRRHFDRLDIRDPGGDGEWITITVGHSIPLMR